MSDKFMGALGSILVVAVFVIATIVCILIPPV